MPSLAVTIMRFIDDHQPGFVECVLVDAQEEKHVFNEKTPVVTREDIWSSSRYPQKGEIPCSVKAVWRDELGASLSRVPTDLPCHVESTEGVSVFTVLSSQVLP